MTLRDRVALLALAVALATVVAFGALVAITFDWQLRSQLVAILEADLERAVALLDQPQLGMSLVGSSAGGSAVQLVGRDGATVFAWGDPAELPDVAGTAFVGMDGRTLLVGRRALSSSAGVVRMAHDVTDALTSVRDVRVVVTIAGVLVVGIVTALAVRWSRRLLAPLADVVAQTRALRVERPDPVRYEGPQDEVAELVTALNGALAGIRERRERERAFLLEVAHELAAPLSLVDYHLASLRRRDPDDGASTAAAAAARELLRTSQDLLVVARGDLRRELASEVIDLRDVLARLAHEYPGIAVRAVERAELVGDPERLMQALRNLVRNAVQATGGVDGVAIELDPSPTRHVVRVLDRGGGIRADALGRVFEHGFSATNGVGVGLAVARDLIERHGGSLRVASSTAEGTVMEAELPSLDARLTSAEGVSDARPGGGSADVD